MKINKRFFLQIFIIHSFVSCVFASNSLTDFDSNLLLKSKQADIWTQPTGKENNMTVYATLFKNDVIYEPDGLLLGVFRGSDNYCYGYDTWLENPSANYKKLHMVLVMSDESNVSGYFFKVYNPTTNQFFSCNETFTFIADGEYGEINNPKKINITESALNDINADYDFNIYPTRVKDNFKVNLSNISNSNIKVELYNLNGTLISNLYSGMSINNINCSIDSNIASGLYLVKVITDLGTMTKKIFIE